MLSFLLIFLSQFSFSLSFKDIYIDCIKTSDQVRKCPHSTNEILEVCKDPQNKENCGKVSTFFLTRAKQAEAKILLTKSYRLMNIIFNSTKSYETSTLNLWQIIKTDSKENYIFALNPNCPGASGSTLDFSNHLSAQVLSIKDKLLSALQEVKIECKDPKLGFTVVALGIPTPEFDKVDIWSIDEKKNLSPIQDSTLNIFSGIEAEKSASSIGTITSTLSTPAKSTVSEASLTAASDKLVEDHLRCKINEVEKRSINGEIITSCIKDRENNYLKIAFNSQIGNLCLAILSQKKINNIVRCYDNGILRFKKAYKDGVVHGLVDEYSKWGTIIKRRMIKNNMLNGQYIEYNIEGKEEVLLNFSDNKRTGSAFYFDKETNEQKYLIKWQNDEIKRVIRYSGGKYEKELKPEEFKSIYELFKDVGMEALKEI